MPGLPGAFPVLLLVSHVLWFIGTTTAVACLAPLRQTSAIAALAASVLGWCVMFSYPLLQCEEGWQRSAECLSPSAVLSSSGSAATLCECSVLSRNAEQEKRWTTVFAGVRRSISYIVAASEATLSLSAVGSRLDGRTINSVTLTANTHAGKT